MITFRLPEGVTPDDVPRPSGLSCTVRGDAVEYRTDKPTKVMHALTGWATARGRELDGLQVMRPSLEDVYLELVGKDGAGDG